MEASLLNDMIVIFGLSIAVLLACHAMRLPSIVGFIFTGVLSGPHGLGLIKRIADVESLANMGIVLLLFSIGMEFSIKKLKEIKRFFLFGGVLQAGLTVLAGYCIGKFLGRPFGESIFLGFILSLSSTAIVLRILQNRSEMDSPHGKAIISILIFQDFIAIPMMLSVPFLNGSHEGGFDVAALFTILKGVLLLIVVYISAVSFVPSLMYFIAKTRNRELFLLTVLTICFSVALLAEHVGLSLSLGAFLAGLIVSETEYSHEAISDILPFKDIFTSVFFVSIGMLLDLSFVFENFVLVILMTIGVLLLKSFIACLTAIFLRLPIRTAVLTGISLCQVGEFSLILVKTGFLHGLGNEYYDQLFLSIALFSMAVTPTLMTLSPYIADLAKLLPLPHQIITGLKANSKSDGFLKINHLIIVGFGVAGKSLAKSAKEANISYIILEMNAETVKIEKARGEPIHFGDATHEILLQHANINESLALAILINDSNAAIRVARVARKLNPNIYIIARTHYMKQMKAMFLAGADDIVSDELHSSIEVFTKVLQKYEVSSDEVERVVTDRRYELLKAYEL